MAPKNKMKPVEAESSNRNMTNQTQEQAQDDFTQQTQENLHMNQNETETEITETAMTTVDTDTVVPLSHEESIARVRELLGSWEVLQATGETLREQLQQEMNQKLAEQARAVSDVVKEINGLGYGTKKLSWTAPDGTSRVTRGIRERKFQNGRGEDTGRPIEGGPLYSFMFEKGQKEKEVVEF